jgi:hypothetical protein
MTALMALAILMVALFAFHLLDHKPEKVEEMPKKTLYGLCEYCDKPALLWHRLGVSVCPEHFDMTVDELLDMEPQWEALSKKRHPRWYFDLDTKARFDYDREELRVR